MRQEGRFTRWESPRSRPLPIRGHSAQTISTAYENANLNGATLLVGVTPQAIPRCIPRLVAFWVALTSAESGADGSNNTSFALKVGANLASLTTIGTVDTSGNPAAGEPTLVSISHVPNPGQLLCVTTTVNGSGTTNFNADDVVFGVEVRQERYI